MWTFHPLGPSDSEPTQMLRKGSFQGRFAGFKTRYDMEETPSRGTFNGVAELLDGPFKGTEFGHSGSVSTNGALTLTRVVSPGAEQVATAGAPKVVARNFVWRGLTKGTGLPPEGLPFLLTVPTII